MYSINGTNIKLTRGDSFYCQISITEDGQTYEPAIGDSVRFAMKDKIVVLEKDIPTDSLVLHLAPDDTSSLAAKEYIYDIELTKANGDVDTFITGVFKLMPDVK